MNRESNGGIVFWAFGVVCAIAIVSGSLEWLGQTRALREAIDARSDAYCEEGESNCTPDDLAAQARMADATEAIFELGVGQLIISFIGVCLVGFALRHSFAQATAALDSVAETRTANERQFRAYVLPVGLNDLVLSSGNMLTGEVKAKNSGQTPAKLVRHALITDITADPATWNPEPYPPPEDGSLAAIGPSCDYRMPVSIARAFTEAEKAALQNKTHILMIAGRIKYEDVFGKARTTWFRYEAHLNGDLVVVRNAPQGNDFT